MVRSSVATGLGLLLCSASLEAQSVRGTLVDRVSGQPIPSAFVTLLNEQGLEVARTLTGAEGIFFLTAPLAGNYRLRSKRIGFRLTQSPPLALADSQIIEYRLEVDAVPVELPAVIVRARPQCGAKAAEAATVAQLWEEAREALAAVKWTQDQATPRYTNTIFERTLPLKGRQVQREWDSAWSGVGRRPFWSVPAEQLEHQGYVVVTSGDSLHYYYYGPDAEVLLGDVFIATHCFSARDGGPEHPGLVGLAFEPAPKRRLPDVAGVLWLERRTLELRFLDFTYTGLWTRELGGRVEFARLASGPWIVAYWWIRTPRLDTTQRYDSRHRAPKMRGYQETGGLVTTVESPQGGIEHAGLETILQGTVVDSTRGGRPLPGAALWLAGTRRSPTDEAGQFEIRGPFDGEYDVSFWHPRLDSLGITADEQRVTLTRGSVQSLTLFVPPESVVVRRLCRKGLGPGNHVIVGLVHDSTMAPVPRARVELRLAGSILRQGGNASEDGRYIICNVPPAAVIVSANGRGASGDVLIEFRENQVWVEGKPAAGATGLVWRQDILVKPQN
jgi:hypothetical protein